MTLLQNNRARETWLVTALIETERGRKPEITPQHGDLRFIKAQRLAFMNPAAKPAIWNVGDDLRVARLVMETLSGLYRVDIEEMLRSQSPRPTLVRHIALYICRLLTKMSLSQCAKKFDRDHSSVVYATKRIKKMRAASKEFDEKMKSAIRACSEACGVLSIEGDF